jgi:hypothetical protein
VLVVSKLDRLGRNAMDVGSTVAKLAGMGVRVHCLALGGVDLASSTGKLTMNVPGFGGGDASAYRSHAARRATPLPFYVHASLRRSRPRMKLSLA